MSQEFKVNPRSVGTFVEAMSIRFSAYAKDRDYMKDRKPEDVFELSIYFGLLLAKKQPELAEAAWQYWNFTRKGDADSFLGSQLELWKGIQERLEK